MSTNYSILRLGWPNCSYGFSCYIIWKILKELSDQPSKLTLGLSVRFCLFNAVFRLDSVN